jgi:hypothetical protein
MTKLGIVILATNAYFVLGLRLIKKFLYHYKGHCNVQFFVFSDMNVRDYLPSKLPDVNCYYSTSSSWVEGTNSKFRNILSIKTELARCDYIYYFDADTNVYADFTEEILIGDVVVAEHYNNTFENERAT